DPGAESVLESLAREFLVSLGLGPVETQFSVVSNGRVHFVDLRVGRQLVEADGEIKYLPTERGGLTDRDPARVVWAEKQRQNQICAEGYGMSRLVWSDLFGSAREATARRILAEYA